MQSTTETQASHSEREHAICSASGAERGLACLGSVAMCALVTPPEESRAAKEGTQAHELSEKLLYPLVFHYNKTGEDAWDTASIMDFTLYEHYPREMFDHCLEYTRLIWDNVREYKPKKIFIETKLDLDKNLQMFGTSDCFFGFKLKDKKILSVWDFKYGKRHVVEVRSAQLPFYANAIINSTGVTPDEAWLNIYQPRAEHKDGEHRVAVLSYKELRDWNEKFLAWGEAAPALIGKNEKELEAYVTTGDHCLFCDGKIACPAYKKKLQQDAGMDFMDDPDLLPAPQDAEGRILSYFQQYPEEAAKFLTAIPRIEKFCTTYKQSSINFIQSGGSIPGWKLVQGRGRRQWKEEAGVADALKKLGVGDPYDRSLRGLGSIETELKALGHKGKKASEAIAHLVQKSTPPYTLAPESDDRQAVTGHEQAQLDFAAVGNEEVD